MREYPSVANHNSRGALGFQIVPPSQPRMTPSRGPVVMRDCPCVYTRITANDHHHCPLVSTIAPRLPPHSQPRTTRVLRVAA